MCRLTETNMSSTERYETLMSAITRSTVGSEINALVGSTTIATGSTIASAINNYKAFFKLLIWLVIQNLWFIITVVANFIFNSNWSYEISKVYNFEDKTMLYIFHSAMMLSNAIEWFVAGKLLMFHLYLKFKRISTFEYIKRNDKNYKSRFVVKKDSILKPRNAPSKDESSV